MAKAKILVAAQPSPGAGWAPIPKVKEEVKIVTDTIPEQGILHLGGTLDHEGAHTTLENVVSRLPEANILHLACHGTQETTDPLKSGFILADGKRLTIEELMRHQLPNAHTAILSACHTASNHTDQLDESINLTSAMLSVGFCSLLATKW